VFKFVAYQVLQVSGTADWAKW